MYILESHNPFGGVNSVNIYNSCADAQHLLKAWKGISGGRYPVTLKRVPKLDALNYYTTNMIKGLRERRDKTKNESAKVEINHVICLLFRIQDSTNAT